MLCCYRGNFGVDYSTEAHIAASLELLGHRVIRLQENTVGWPETLEACKGADLFLWTCTWGYALEWDQDEAERAVATLNERLPTAGVHLDLWHGLSRAEQVGTNAFWHLRDVFTADGDHPDEFAAANVRHHWLPPGVYGPECIPGTYRPNLACDVAFVGNWRGGYHEEHWPKRKALLDFLRIYPANVQFWPKGPAIRGAALNDLYRSASVTVGDSCFAGQGARFYWSDRATECVGRGGVLVMPWIEGLSRRLIDGKHCRYFTAGDFDELGAILDHLLTHPEVREELRREGQAYVRDNETYAHRMTEMLTVLGLS